MSFFEILDKVKRKNASLILYSLLDRIPIIVFGDKSDDVDKFLIELSNLSDFREEFVFSTDFVSKDEYNNLIQNEDIDYNIQRVLIRCPCDVSIKALNLFDNFFTWIIGTVISKEGENLKSVKNLIRNKSKVFLSIVLASNTISVELEGINLKLIDLSLENNILQKISEDTENSVARMKRVLSDRIKLNQLEKDFAKTLFDFENEKNELRINIFKKEIQNFYAGSKRAFFILFKLKLLSDMEMDAKIGSKTLLETIDYEEAPIGRILSFIYKEWKEDFSNLIEEGDKVYLGDKIVSLWG